MSGLMSLFTTETSWFAHSGLVLAAAAVLGTWWLVVVLMALVTRRTGRA